MACIMSSRNHLEYVRKILATVESGSFISIHDLAVEFKLSASYLQHLFKARTGSRLGRRLAEMRLRRAAFLLVQSDSSIKEISYAVGYRHPSSFIRAFERFFRQSPSDYRQEMLTERRFG
jgi:two-component system response regulator YesN